MIFEKKTYEIQFYNSACRQKAKIEVLDFTKSLKSIKILITLAGGQCFRRTVKLREDENGQYILTDVLKNKIRPENTNV